MQAQSKLNLLKSIAAEANTFSTDKMGNVYLAQKNGLHVYNEQGDSIGFFGLIRRGTLTQIDVSNPMRILLYYADIPQITILNRLYIEQTSLDLKKVNIYNCPAVSFSADGDIWLYNNFTYELKKINDDLSFQPYTLNLQQLLHSNITPSQITEQDRYLFVVDSLNGILKFDRFGNYMTTYHLKTNSIQYINKQLIYKEGDYLKVYNTEAIKEKSILLPNPEDIMSLRVERNRLYLLRKSSLDIYSL
jgi:hypothetical protein